MANLKKFLIGDITKLSVEEAKLCARIAFEYEVDKSVSMVLLPSINVRFGHSRGVGSFGSTRTTAARFPTSLPYKSGGRIPKDRQNIPTNPVQ